MTITPRINTIDAPAPATRLPIRNWVAAGASAATLVSSPLWVSELVIAALRPLGPLDTSIAQWMALFALPIMVLLALSARSVIWSRSHYPVDYLPLEKTLGVKLATLAAAANLITRITTVTLLASVIALLIRSTWPAYRELALPVSLSTLLWVGIGASLKWRRYPQLTAAMTLVAAITIVVLTGGFMGASPHFLTTSSQDLAQVSREVSQRSESSWRLFSASVTGLIFCLTPALLGRYLVHQRKYFNPPRSAHAATTLLVGVIVTGLLVLLTLRNIADVDAGTFLVRRNVTFSALRAITFPQWGLVATALIFFAVTISALRNVVDCAAELTKDLTRGKYLPAYLAHSVEYTGTVPLLTVFTAAALLVATHAELTPVVTLFLLGAITSTALTRWGSFRHWRYMLRTEGHSLRRIAMKQARIQALVGLGVAGIIGVAFLLVSPTATAWIAVALLALAYLILYWLRRHQLIDERERQREAPLTSQSAPTRIHTMVLVQAFDAASERAVRWSLAAHPYSMEIVHVDRSEADSAACLRQWRELALPVDLTVVQTSRPYIIKSVRGHIARYRQAKPSQVINLVIPEVIYPSALQALIHNAEVRRLKRALRKEVGVCLTTVPWHRESSHR